MSNNSNIIKLAGIFLLMILGSIFLGVSSATDQIGAVTWVVVLSSIGICILLGNKVWYLIPIMTALSIELPIPGVPSTGELAQVAFIFFSILLTFTRKIKLKLNFGWMEFWCLVLAAMVIQVYVRHPVGLRAIGSGSVGARAYLTFGLDFATAFFLGSYIIEPSNFKNWLKLTMTGALLNFLIGISSFFAPGMDMYLGKSITAGAASAGTGASRIGFVRILCDNIAIYVSSLCSPFFGSFRPYTGSLIFLSLILAGLSGFRSQLALIFLIFLVAIIIWDGLKGVFAASMIGAIFLVLLSLVNSLVSLPPNIQRSFSFLPGTWDERIVADTNDSTDWRVEMWKVALTSEDWIKNTMIGDGMGMTAEELDRVQRYTLEGRDLSGTASGLTVQQESFLIVGNYHSGPVHTIRTVGYVGLVFLLIAQLVVMYCTLKTIKKYWNSHWRMDVLFIGVPLVAFPISWWFLFGEFETATKSVLLGSGLLRLIVNNLDPDEIELSQ